jgi:arsenate reductase-like glutaredoxin family protein
MPNRTWSAAKKKKNSAWREIMSRSEILMKKLLPLAPFRWESERAMNGVVKSRVKSLKRPLARRDRQVGLGDLPGVYQPTPARTTRLIPRLDLPTSE